MDVWTQRGPVQSWRDFARDPLRSYFHEPKKCNLFLNYSLIWHIMPKYVQQQNKYSGGASCNACNAFIFLNVIVRPLQV